MPAEPRAERSELYFRSGDARCHGWLYMPGETSLEAGPPIIVMAHGLGAVKALAFRRSRGQPVSIRLTLCLR